MQHKLKSAFESGSLLSGPFFRHQQWKSFFIFLFFLLLAFVFWFLQTLQQDYEQRIEYALQYKNVPVEWVLSENNPQTVSALLKEKGATLLYYLWYAPSHAIDISISGLSPLSDSTLQITNRMLEVELSKQLFASTSILSFEPREIELRYDMLGSRLSHISAQVVISTKPGFQLSDNITVSPSEVRLFGSNKALALLNEIKTKPTYLEDVSKTTELTVQLDLPTGVKSDYETVRLTVPVEEFTEKKIQIPVLCPDIPENYVLRMFPSSVEITCYLPLSQFRELTEEKLEIMIPFAEFEKNKTTGKIPVRLTRKPAWVSNAVVSPNELEFIIEHHD